jgi:hypothetical protein
MTVLEKKKKMDEEEQEIISIWEKTGITRAILTFDCGGDSMGNMEWKFYGDHFGTEEEEEIENEDLGLLLDDLVFDKVEFYVNSDGYYQGEAGTVTVTLSDNEEPKQLQFYKDAKAEYNESEICETGICLDEKECRFLTDKMLSISGNSGVVLFVYKGDCILTDEEEKVVTSLEGKLHRLMDDLSDNPIVVNEEMEDVELRNISTGGEWNEITPLIISETNGDPWLKLSVSYSGRIYRDSE